MSARFSVLTHTVARCVPRQDGGFLIVTTKGQSGVSLAELPEGARVVIADGQVMRAVR